MFFSGKLLKIILKQNV